MRRAIAIIGWAALAACASTPSGEANGPAEAQGGLDLESTAQDVYQRCVRVQGTSPAEAWFDCGALELALHVGDDGQAFLDGRLATAIGAVGAGPVRAAPFLLPVAGESSTVLRTVVYADAEEETEAMIHLGVFVTDARLALSCVARADLPTTGDVCARVIDQVALAPPGDLAAAPPPKEEPPVEAEIFKAKVTLPAQCELAAGPEITEVTCAFAKATVRRWATSEEAASAATEPVEVLKAYGATVELRRLSCEILGGTGGCLVGEVHAGDDEGQGVVFGHAQLGTTWVSLECTAPRGLSDPLCVALATVH